MCLCRCRYWTRRQGTADCTRSRNTLRHIDCKRCPSTHPTQCWSNSHKPCARKGERKHLGRCRSRRGPAGTPAHSSIRRILPSKRSCRRMSPYTHSPLDRCTESHLFLGTSGCNSPLKIRRRTFHRRHLRTSRSSGRSRCPVRRHCTARDWSKSRSSHCFAGISTCNSPQTNLQNIDRTRHPSKSLRLVPSRRCTSQCQ